MKLFLRKRIVWHQNMLTRAEDSYHRHQSPELMLVIKKHQIYLAKLVSKLGE